MPETERQAETQEEVRLKFTIDTDALRDLTLAEWATMQKPKDPWDLIALLKRLTKGLDVENLRVREMKAVAGALAAEMNVLTEGN